MRAAPLHPRERERVEALRNLELLDTLEDPAFQGIVELASTFCGTPVSLVTLLDERRQWFKAKVGVELSETAKEHAFCAHAILSESLFEVPDASVDPRFSDNPYVIGEPHVRFYAGQRFCTPDGLPLGTVCVLHSEPLQLSDVQRDCLRRLALQVEKLIELKLRLQEVSSLRDESLLHREAMEQMSEGFVIHNSSGHVVHFNSAAAHLLGKSREELAGASSLDLRSLEFTRELGLGDAKVVGVPIEHAEAGQPLSRPVRWLAVRSDPVRSKQDENSDSANSYTVTTLTDVTLLRESQRRLMQDAKTKSLGVLAGGLAHEMNNPLSIVVGNAELLKIKLGEARIHPDLFARPLDVIARTGLKMAKLVRALSDFAGDFRAQGSATITLAALVESSFALVAPKFQAHGISLNTDIVSDARVSIPMGALTQVVVNLLENAFDAVKNLDEKFVTLRIEAASPVVRLWVIDSGHGVPEDVAVRMMDPFFTTKTVGEGMGLGLSVAQGLLERFEARLDYALWQGHTAFVVTLPMAEEKLLNPTSR